MDNLFNGVLTSSSDELTVLTAILTMAATLFLGCVIAFTYRKTQTDALYQRSLAITLFMLPIIMSVIILFVGSNIARAFSLAGTLSIIRFRSAPGDARDIGFIFFDIAAGLACGVGLYGYGILFVAVLCIALLIAEKINLFKEKGGRMNLEIVIPENLNSRGAFDDIFEKYTAEYNLIKIKTTDLGSLFKLVYSVRMFENADEQEFLNELRTRNGNLTIMLSQANRVSVKSL